MPCSLNIFILSDYNRGSYHIIGNFYMRCLTNLCEVTHLPTPKNQDERNALRDHSKETIVLHNTLGEGFTPIDGCYNIAMPLHEWSEYPQDWINLLNKFDEVWTTTDHLGDLLNRGGVRVPLHKLPPALDTESLFLKKSWGREGKVKFFFVGEPHFRKGHHLLMQGFMKAFPNSRKAHLTIKTSPNCQWDSPREDISLIREDWPRDRLLAEYARHDCFVSASLGEGLGLPIAEAIMADLPVCANYWGGHKSLLEKGSFMEVEHEEILQPFTSDPKFYAEGQKCAYSSPEKIKLALMQFLELEPLEKERMVKLAKEYFLKRYGSPSATEKIHKRINEIRINLV